MSNTTLEKYKRKWFSKNVQPISLTPQPSSRSSASSSSTQSNNTTSSSTTSSSSSQSNTNNVPRASSETPSNTTSSSFGVVSSLIQRYKPYLYTSLCLATLVFGVMGLIGILFCPTCGLKQAPTPAQPTSVPGLDDDVILDVAQPQPEVPEVQLFMSLCLWSYHFAILSSIIVFVSEFLTKFGWKKYSYVMFDADGQYAFIALFYLASGKSAVFLLLLMLSALVRALPHLATVTNNNPKVLELQAKIYQFDLGDKFARLEMFLLVNELLSFAIFKVIIVTNFICHRYLIFPQLRNYITAINNALNQYVPNVLRGIYDKICYYLSTYVASLQQRKTQVEQGQ